MPWHVDTHITYIDIVHAIVLIMMMISVYYGEEMMWCGVVFWCPESTNLVRRKKQVKKKNLHQLTQ